MYMFYSHNAHTSIFFTMPLRSLPGMRTPPLGVCLPTPSLARRRIIWFPCAVAPSTPLLGATCAETAALDCCWDSMKAPRRTLWGKKNLRIHKAPLNSGGLCLRMKILGVLILIFEIYYLIIDSIYVLWLNGTRLLIGYKLGGYTKLVEPGYTLLSNPEHLVD